MSYFKWLKDPWVVTAGSTDTAVKGTHFYKDMRIKKELFCTLVKHKVKILISKCEEFKVYF